MDALDEAGLDLELSEFGKRLDSLLIARGWQRRLRGVNRDGFELSARRCGPDRVRLALDVTIPEGVAQQIIALVVRHGLRERTASEGETRQK